MTLSFLADRLMRLWGRTERHAQGCIRALRSFPFIIGLVSRFLDHGEPMSDSNAEVPQPTYMDHRYLRFWPWACVTNGQEYLRTSAAFWAAIAVRPIPGTDFMQQIKNRERLRDRMELAKYHFVSSVGSLLRHMKRTHMLFPSIKDVWDKAEHLQKEGKDLRDMIEHADDYLTGKGQKQQAFIREAEGLLTNLPGDKPGLVDATSDIIDGSGHWLGGRLSVEKAIEEAGALLVEAEKIPPPVSPRRGRPGAVPSTEQSEKQ
jgi:hypothetical protein